MPEPSDSKPQISDVSYGGLQAKFERGIALHQQGKLADAERIYWDVFQQQPNHFRALHLLGAVALQTGQTERALELIGKAIALKPDYAEAHYNRGLALMQLNRPREALASYDQAIALNPNYTEAHNNGGVALRDLKRPDDALKSFEMAIALKPDYAEAHYNRGLALMQLNRPREALASYDQAIALNPNYVEAYNNRGTTLYDLKRFAEALASFDQAIVLNPESAMAHNNRARVLAKLNRYNEAFAAYDRAFALDPDTIGVEGDRLGAKMQICDWRNYESECTHLISSVRNGRVNPPFHFLAISSSSDDQLQCAKLLIANKFPPSRKPIWRGERYHHKRIRVAYLSSDFREHAMSYLAAGMFEGHDKSLFDVTAISCGPDDNSEIRKRVTNSFERFIDAEKYSDERIANLVKELEIDIFVDLAGNTTGSRLGVFAKRPAPIQVNYLGYPGTMGAQYIHYIIADRIIVPEGQQKFYSEKIVVLPNSYQVTDSKRPIADRVFSRAELGLPSTGFVFCCFNRNDKITPHLFDCWMRILKKVDGSVLWLFESNATVAANLKKEAIARGISAERLIFAKRLPQPDHLARHRLADLFLDTLPYNAHTTASDALWADLPVLTQIGATFAGRVAASLLMAIGLPELITATPQAYENLAIELANNPEKLTTIKRRLAENRLTMPLFDTKLFTQHIEAGYTAMYERYQAGLPPDHICI